MVSLVVFRRWKELGNVCVNCMWHSAIIDFDMLASESCL